MLLNLDKADPAPEIKDSKWRAESAAWRNKLRISPDYSPWTSRQDVKLFLLPQTERVKDLVNVCAAECLVRHREEKVRQPNWSRWGWVTDVLADVSQSHSRKTFTNSLGVNPCMTTSSIFYSFGMDRALIPLDHLKMQGLPAQTMSFPIGITQANMRDLAGNMMFLPSLATVLTAVLLAVDFPDFKATAAGSSQQQRQ
jgi:hypothetical protein